ncbi:MAG: MFS transporter [Burkholderiales bacterium]|nr:MFS transporter [Burkholderiales bacterium]MDE1926220.1 MFS transporter [Burkholderiales bacterium]MDE2157848.1 MFS transporter [Burkholderiales bacterium]MDE2502828.1 MFS transporter [Burkholderiales bacterium]
MADLRLGKPRLALFVLTLIATVQFFDRALMVVVMEPIKREFTLSDAQLGLLAGFSYAAAFALAGLPLGWLADRANRRNLLGVLLAAWSALVALAGSAGSYGALVATRIGIGAMDAGGQPCSVSMIADLAPRERRAGAVAVFYAGVPLGMLLGFMAGGLIAGRWGWRAGFYFAALPGALLALALFLFVREPRRGATETETETGTETAAQPADAALAAAPPPLAETLRFMAGQASLVALIAASVLVTGSSSAMMSWIGSLLVRTHHLSLPVVGAMTALCMGGFGAVGTVVAGRLADRLGAVDMRWQPRLMAVAAALIAVFGSAVCLLDWVPGVAIALALFAACVAGLNGPTYALTQSLVRLRMRGISLATLVVLLNLIGVGVGPTLAGWLSDLFAARYGADSVRWAMVCVLALNLPAVAIFWRAAAGIRADLERAAAAPAIA